jgi:hypothetical protein
VRGSHRSRDFFFAGLALGFAFLSKYFAVLTGMSFAVLLLACLGRPRIKALLVLLAGVVPGVGINIAWNYHPQLDERVVQPGHAPRKIRLQPVLLGCVCRRAPCLGRAGRVAALLRWKDQDRGSRAVAWRKMQEDGTAVFLVAFAVPLAAFFLVAFTYNIGAHWLVVILSAFRGRAVCLHAVPAACGA